MMKVCDYSFSSFILSAQETGHVEVETRKTS